MKLILDLAKASLNRGKLVKRMVQVRGKNGKIFTRMQWVDPNDEQQMSPHLHADDDSHTTKKEHIDKHVKGLSPEEKDELMKKHGIEYKAHENPARNQINKVMALKAHLMKNPHLVGAHHLPDERKITGDEALHEATQHFLDALTKGKKNLDERRSALHKMIHDEGFITKHPDFDKLKLHNSPLDPKNYKPGEHFADEDEQTRKAPIHHMHRMRLFKEHLKQNPHRIKELMDDPEHAKWFDDEHREKHSHFGLDGDSQKTPPKPKPEPMLTVKPDPKVEPKDTPKLQPKPEPAPSTKDGQEIAFGKLAAHLGRDKVYQYLKDVHGEDIVDPKDDPNIKDTAKPIAHMRNMEKFKRLLLENPSHLKEHFGSNVYVKEIHDAATKAGVTLDGTQSTPTATNDYANNLEKQFSKLNKDTKKKYVEMFKNHPLVNKSRLSQWEKGDHNDVGYSTAWGEVKRVLKENPDLYEKHKEEFDSDYLMDTTKPNVREVTRFIRDSLGITQGLKNGERVELDGDREDRMWIWYPDNSAQITRDDDGKPIFSVFYGGPDGTEDHLYEIPLKDFRDFIDNLRANPDTTESKPRETKEKVEGLPLHMQSGPDIIMALTNDISKLTDDVVNSKKFGDFISRTWEKHNYTGDMTQLALQSKMGTAKVYREILSKMGAEFDGSGTLLRSFYQTDAGKKLMYQHLVQPTKPKDSDSLIINNRFHTAETWLLHESAKKWTLDERAESKKEFLHKGMKISRAVVDTATQKEFNHHFARLLHDTLDNIPYDIFSDMYAQGHLKFDINKSTGNGSHHNPESRAISLSSKYLVNHKRIDESSTPHDLNTVGNTIQDTAVHEVGHAFDHFMTVGMDKPDWNKPYYLNWTNSKNSKYLNGASPTVVNDSYVKAVKAFNPEGKFSKAMNGTAPYEMHLDNFISAYEGRIYARLGRASAGKNGKTGPDITNDTHMFGLEHWSEGFSRVLNAHRVYREMQANGHDMDMNMHDLSQHIANTSRMAQYQPSIATQTGDRSQDGSFHGLKATGANADHIVMKGYHIMRQRHPELVNAIEGMFLRNDFLDGSGEHPRASSVVKKSVESEKLYIKL